MIVDEVAHEENAGGPFAGRAIIQFGPRAWSWRTGSCCPRSCGTPQQPPPAAIGTQGNWVGGAIPTASNNVVINLTSSGTVTHSTGANDAALSLTTNGNTALSIGSGSIELGDGSSSSVP